VEKKVLSVKHINKKQITKSEEPKRLSKLGEWMRANPKGIGLVIHDMKAVMK
jgi:hypothetical protein